MFSFILFTCLQCGGNAEVFMLLTNKHDSKANAVILANDLFAGKIWRVSGLVHSSFS